MMIVVASGLLAVESNAHPGNGIVVAPSGDVYFSDVERNIIWRCTSAGVTTPFATGLHSHSIGLDARGNLYAEHLRFIPDAAEGRQWETRLVLIDPTGAQRTLLQPTIERHQFGGSPFMTESAGGVISLAQSHDAGRVLVRFSSDGDASPLKSGTTPPGQQASPVRLIGIGGICADTHGGFVASQKLTVLRINPSGEASLLVDLSGRALPTDPASPRVDAIWGVACGADGMIYAADWDARAVHRVTPQGEASIAARSVAPWSPSGVVAAGEALYILEHGVDRDVNLGPRVRVVGPGGVDRVIATAHN